MFCKTDDDVINYLFFRCQYSRTIWDGCMVFISLKEQLAEWNLFELALISDYHMIFVEVNVLKYLRMSYN